MTKPKRNTQPIVMVLGGRPVRIFDAGKAQPATMHVSTDMYNAILKELQDGKATSKEG